MTMTTTTEAEVKAQAQQQAPVPQIDMKKLIEQVSTAAAESAGKVAEKRAGEIADKRMKEAARVLTGEPSKPQSEQVIEALVQDPVRMFHNSKEAAKAEIREELRQQNETARIETEVVGKAIKEYPGLNTKPKLAAVLQLSQQYQAAGQDYQTSLDMACKDIIKDSNLVSVTEAERTSNPGAIGLPHGGGLGSGAPSFNEAKSTTDFIKSLQSKASSFKKRS